MPKLSVIIPCRNVQEFAPDALRGLANNVGPDVEFLLVDDRSTDATPQLFERAAAELPRTRVLHHRTNLGISAARNTGIEAARGEYLTFLDGDDWYAPGYLPRLLRTVEELDCDFLRVDHVRCTGSERVVRRAPAPRRGVVLDPLDSVAPAHRETMVDYPFVWAGVYHRRLFEDDHPGGALRFHPSLRTAEDRVFVWQLHLRARTFAAAGLLGVFYRRGVTTSLTQIRDARQLDFIPAHDLILREVERHPQAERFLPKIVRTYCAMIAFHAQSAERYEPAAARTLRRESAAALRRMPRAVLERTLAELNPERRGTLRRLMGGTRKVVGA
ncbi:glycosyltransferase family 2 protein [Streptomyces sp. NPDC005438]|uniref:glycosyltransferase family 2 protein n=1 Tax=Streptomyces sp. NPDC005438 TaxID=3156880 RepID=UPI0033B6A2F2